MTVVTYVAAPGTSPPSVTSPTSDSTKCALRMISEVVTVYYNKEVKCRTRQAVLQSRCEGSCGQSSESSPVRFVTRHDNDVSRLNVNNVINIVNDEHETYQLVLTVLHCTCFLTKFRSTATATTTTSTIR